MSGLSAGSTGEIIWPDPHRMSGWNNPGSWDWLPWSAYGAWNFKGSGENHKNPITNTFILLQGKLFAKTFLLISVIQIIPA